MMDFGPAALALLVLATAAGATVQAATGFGFAILAAPVFLAVLETTAAVPILVGLHVVQSAMLVPSLWRQAPRRLLGRLLAGAAVGCPAGLALFNLLDLGQLKLVAGLVILLAALLLALRRAPSPLDAPPAGDAASLAGGLAAGSAAGALTALLVMPGPPLMVYLMRAPRGAAEARALSLSFFAACYVLVLAMSIAAGTLGAGDWWLMAALAGPVVVGTLAGRRLAPRLTNRQFMRALYVLLALAGVGALLSAG